MTINNFKDYEGMVLTFVPVSQEPAMFISTRKWRIFDTFLFSKVPVHIHIHTQYFARMIMSYNI